MTLWSILSTCSDTSCHSDGFKLVRPPPRCS
ncbi:CxxxxCH/CxxCH domain-containing protein [Mesobacillus maritimus]